MQPVLLLLWTVAIGSFLLFDLLIFIAVGTQLCGTLPPSTGILEVWIGKCTCVEHQSNTEPQLYYEVLILPETIEACIIIPISACDTIEKKIKQESSFPILMGTLSLSNSLTRCCIAVKVYLQF